MNKTFSDPDFFPCAVNDLEGKDFLVDDYQRGFKWSCQQAVDLLTDIDDFPADFTRYCLQPVVIKDTRRPAGEKRLYELIDGQQRMTTIYIILRVLDSAGPFFNINYNTRPRSAEFLEKIISVPAVSYNGYDPEKIEEMEEEISAHWDSYISEKKVYDNVDNFHFYRVYQTVQLWFEQKDDDAKQAFRHKLLNDTYVIWYEVKPDEISEKVFININSGKIALTNAELIKALFLINCRDHSSPELSRLRQDEIAQEWDQIEYNLQRDDFWYFIRKKVAVEDAATRIDLLFDLITKKREDDPDNYFSYRYYARRVKNKQKLDWQEVKNLYDRLQEWYEERSIYHLVGFIVTRGFSTIPALIKLSKDKGKRAFREELVKIIRKRFKTISENIKVYDLDNLNYEENKERVKDVLLLFNIETFEVSDADFRFPFDRFKKEEWSIEHIHAQNTKLFTLKKEAGEWAADITDLLDDLKSSEEADPEQITKLGQLITPFIGLDGDEKIPQNLLFALEEAAKQAALLFEVHSLSNMALLDRNTNSALGNMNFLNKRKKILEIDKTGWAEIKGRKVKAFVPVCTKNVFMKYYTTEASVVQMSYWGYRDRQNYYEAVDEKLKTYYE
jgi:hypothetical protein